MRPERSSSCVCVTFWIPWGCRWVQLKRQSQPGHPQSNQGNCSYGFYMFWLHVGFQNYENPHNWKFGNHRSRLVFHKHTYISNYSKEFKKYRLPRPYLWFTKSIFLGVGSPGVFVTSPLGGYHSRRPSLVQRLVFASPCCAGTLEFSSKH